MRYFLIFLLAAVSLYSCSDDPEPVADPLGLRYYPLDSGFFRNYLVKQTDFLITGDSAYREFELQERIEGFFINNQDTTYLLNRLSRMDDSEPWVLDSIWQVRRNPNNLVVIENNLPFIKIGFPASEGLSWDGNRTNILMEDTYTIISQGQAYAGEFFTFEDVLIVEQEDNPDPIVRFEQRFELYAANVGLIKKENLTLNYCTEADCLGEQQVETGVRYVQEIIGFGND